MPPQADSPQPQPQPQPRTPVHARARPRRRGEKHDDASFYDARVVQIFSAKKQRAVSPYSHGSEWKRHRQQSPEVQLVREAMSAEPDAASDAPDFFDAAVVGPILKHHKKQLPPLPGPEPEPAPEPEPEPELPTTVARHAPTRRARTV